ncbi:MAG TPA: ATPase, T2SS/T4P/T4SS family [Thiobacillaceae bacterium]|nr:ATPase, T2SS/T4P/T4SS family [Thiobacillaceae bacterium]HNU64159.1 ATPase, T2SS/T4P/T4SS family [Thiobacillaceae bacterium]
MALSEATLINAGLQAGLLDAETVARLRVSTRARGQGLLDTLSRELKLPRSAFHIALAQMRGLPFLAAGEVEADLALLARLPASLQARTPVAPVRLRQGGDYWVVADPEHLPAVEQAVRLTSQERQAALTEPEAIEAWLAALPNTRLGKVADPVTVFDQILREAALRRASDVHLEWGRDALSVRLRVDGLLQPFGVPLPRQVGEALVSRFKVLSGLDIAESRLPQDGALRHALAEAPDAATEYRVASIPSKFGERITVRVMKTDGDVSSLDSLGMPEAMMAALGSALRHPHGILLLTGPTGSGKSTTLYAALREIDCTRLNVLTAEDPVEQVLPGITQVQVGGKLTFVGALRAFLRHDPDVILVGEVRDADTADMAMKAATTGHMVLSSLHTNSAPGAVARLADLGAERYMIAASLRGVIAQRLVRRLCPRCRQPEAADAGERRLLGMAQEGGGTLYRPRGCAHCLNTGYRGRVGLFESLWLDAGLARSIAMGAGEAELVRLAGDAWYPLAADARAKVLAGLTGLDEVRPYLMEFQ